MKLSDMLTENFKAIITKGAIEKEITVSDIVKITIAPLNEGQLLAAKLAISNASKMDLPTYYMLEQIERLSRAVTKVNGQDLFAIAKAEMEESKESYNIDEFVALSIKKILLTLPAQAVASIAEEYNALVKEQFDALKVATENF